jgi:hypothetical protein
MLTILDKTGRQLAGGVSGKPRHFEHGSGGLHAWSLIVTVRVSLGHLSVACDDVIVLVLGSRTIWDARLGTTPTSCSP